MLWALPDEDPPMGALKALPVEAPRSPVMAMLPAEKLLEVLKPLSVEAMREDFSGKGFPAAEPPAAAKSHGSM